MRGTSVPIQPLLYQLIGTDWEWGDLDDWTDDQWRAIIEREDQRTWVAYFRGCIAGYFELYRPDAVDVEIRYFGLAAECTGKGFGGLLLSYAIETSWNLHGTKRVWVHTCTFDHPSALTNYVARGMVVYKEELSSSS